MDKDKLDLLAREKEIEDMADDLITEGLNYATDSIIYEMIDSIETNKPRLSCVEKVLRYQRSRIVKPKY